MPDNRKNNLKGHRYLNNYKQDVSGAYRYTGDFYRWVSDKKRACRNMWGLSLMEVVLGGVGGSMPKAGMEGHFYALGPFVIMLIFICIQIYALGNLSMIKEDIKDYEYERYFKPMPVFNMITAVAAAVAAIGQTVNVATGWYGEHLLYGIALILVELVIGALAYLYYRYVKVLVIEKI